jgi:hypothetical protein
MLPHEPSSPCNNSGNAANNSDDENTKKIDLALKMEATRQFLSENRKKESNRSARRASLSTMPSPPVAFEAGNVASVRGSSSRRASLGAAPAGYAVQPRRSSIKKTGAPSAYVDDDADGYSTDSEARDPSRRAKARRASLDVKHQMHCEQRSRRGSLTGRAVHGFDMEGSYRFDTDDVDDSPLQRSSSGGGGRRASLNGSMTRRGSNAGMSRRMSGHGALPVKRQGINPDALARMSRRMSGTTGVSMEDDDDEMEYDGGYGYGPGGADLYGYGFGAQSTPVPTSKYDRRGSHRSRSSFSSATGPDSSAPPTRLYERRGSHSSNASARSRRRNSFLVRDESDPRLAAEMAAAHPRVSDSELEPSSGEDTGRSGVASYTMSYDSESEMSESSFRSDRVHSRRNSVIIRPDQDPYGPVPDNDDPDSLLSRSGYYSGIHKQKMLPQDQLDEEDSNILGLSKAEQSHTTLSRHVNADLASPAHWDRAAPFTTPRTGEPPGKENPDGTNQSLSAAGYSHHNTPWGDTGMNSLSSSEDSDSDASFGASLYEDTRTYPEYDRYQQRARRRESIENTWLDINDLILTSTKARPPTVPQGKKVPDFKPATGCTNASDHIVRCFSARMRTGMTIIKHNRSMFSKSQLRVLYLLPDGKTLSWKPMEGEADKGKRPKLDLTKCLEVRHAWQPDPEARKQLGTSTLRKRCKDGSANKSFSLIFHKRTLDVTALSTDQCRVLMEGFSALAFRLQYDHMNDDDCNSAEDNRKDVTGRSYINDDDWASTVYGGESTVSMTQSGFSVAQQPALPAEAPWGL